MTNLPGDNPATDNQPQVARFSMVQAAEASGTLRLLPGFLVQCATHPHVLDDPQVPAPEVFRTTAAHSCQGAGNLTPAPWAATVWTQAPGAIAAFVSTNASQMSLRRVRVRLPAIVLSSRR